MSKFVNFLGSFRKCSSLRGKDWPSRMERILLSIHEFTIKLKSRGLHYHRSILTLDLNLSALFYI